MPPQITGGKECPDECLVVVCGCQVPFPPGHPETIQVGRKGPTKIVRTVRPGRLGLAIAESTIAGIHPTIDRATINGRIFNGRYE